MNISLSKLASALTVVGVLLIGAGLSVWAWNLPPLPSGMREGYSQCLWSSTYQVEMKGTVDVLAQFRNPLWDPANTSCANAMANRHVNLERQAKRQVERILNGVYLNDALESEPPIFIRPPFLNGLGLILLLIGLLIRFSLVKKSDADATVAP